MLKINGPINEPCGTPFDKPNHSLYLSPNFTLCDLSQNNFLIAHNHMHLHLIHKLKVCKCEVYMANSQTPLINQSIKPYKHCHHLKLSYI